MARIWKRRDDELKKKRSTSYKKVVKTTKTKNRRPINALQLAASNQNGAELLKEIQTQEFDHMMHQAYASKQGYYIGDYHGQKVMIIAGSKSIRDWYDNATEAGTQLEDKYKSRKYKRPVHSAAADKRQKAQALALDKIASVEKPNIIFTHSRGSAVGSHMKHQTNYVGLDGAEVIATGQNKYINIYSTETKATAIKKLVPEIIKGKAKSTAIAATVGEGVAVTAEATVAGGLYAAAKATEYGDTVLAQGGQSNYAVSETNPDHSVYNNFPGYVIAEEDKPRAEQIFDKIVKGVTRKRGGTKVNQTTVETTGHLR